MKTKRCTLLNSSLNTQSLSETALRGIQLFHFSSCFVRFHSKLCESTLKLAAIQRCMDCVWSVCLRVCVCMCVSLCVAVREKKRVLSMNERVTFDVCTDVVRMRFVMRTFTERVCMCGGTDFLIRYCAQLRSDGYKA